MLKIKSNTNEFTIIFFWEDLKENKCWKIIYSALSVQHPFSVPALIFLFLSAPHTSFSFLFPGQPPLYFFSFLLAFFFFSLVCCPLFFSPKYFFFSTQMFFSPKTLFSAQNVFASAQNFFQFSQKHFFFFFSVQPLFSSSSFL